MCTFLFMISQDARDIREIRDFEDFRAFIKYFEASRILLLDSSSLVKVCISTLDKCSSKHKGAYPLRVSSVAVMGTEAFPYNYTDQRSRAIEVFTIAIGI